MFSFVVMTVLILSFIAIVVYVGKALVMEQEQQAEQDILSIKDSYENIIHEKDHIAREKRALEEQASDAFVLYQMTSSIARHMREEEALEVFLNELNVSVRIKDCQLLEHYSPDLQEFHSFQGYEVFPLKNKRKNLGYLLYTGLHRDDKDKFQVLAHQFAMGLSRIWLYKELEQLAMTDSLTGVFTRRYFMERFTDELFRSQAQSLPLSVLMVDTDHFKNINDEHGHLIGDQVLKEISRIIKESIREIDFIGRYGGEEFCVILPNTDHKEAAMVAERMRYAVENTELAAHDICLKATVSVGASSFPDDGNNEEELLDKADWALYRAKKMGRNRICLFGVYREEADRDKP